MEQGTVKKPSYSNYFIKKKKKQLKYLKANSSDFVNLKKNSLLNLSYDFPNV